MAEWRGVAPGENCALSNNIAARWDTPQAGLAHLLCAYRPER